MGPLTVAKGASPRSRRPPPPLRQRATAAKPNSPGQPNSLSKPNSLAKPYSLARRRPQHTQAEPLDPEPPPLSFVPTLLCARSGSSPQIVKLTAMRLTPSNSPVASRPTYPAANPQGNPATHGGADAPAAAAGGTPILPEAAAFCATTPAGATAFDARRPRERQQLRTGEAAAAGSASDLPAAGSPVATILAEVLQAAKALRPGSEVRAGQGRDFQPCLASYSLS